MELKKMLVHPRRARAVALANDLQLLTVIFPELARVIATAGQARPGFVLFGPFASLTKGKYKIEITYGPSEGEQRWEIVVGRRTIAAGNFASTSETDAAVTVPVELAADVDGFEVRSLFSGNGRLTLRSENSYNQAR